MAKKSDKPEPSSAQKQLEQRVDEMMDIKRDSAKVSEVAAAVNESLSQELDEKPSKPKPIKVEKVETKARPVKKVATAPELPDLQAAEGDVSLSDESESSPEASEEPTEKPANDEFDSATKLNDTQTDQAVEDIVAHEGDTVLAVEDVRTNRKKQAAEDESEVKRYNKWAAWGWLVIIILLLVLGYIAIEYFDALDLIIGGVSG